MNECGANNYFFENNTIHFVIKGYQCVVRVRQINSVFITARLEMDYDKFFDDDKTGDKFINTVIAFLNVESSKLKIVGHKRGSVILTTSLEPKEFTTNPDQAAASDKALME